MTRYCVDCDLPTTGPAVTIPAPDSASGARPDNYAHPSGDPECGAVPVPRSPLRRRRALTAH